MTSFLFWVRNASVRTVRAVVPALVHPDDAWAEARLEPNEYALYCRMDRRDRDHAVAVAKELASRHPHAAPETVRAALLHDLGKAHADYRPLERIFVHLVTPRGLPPEPRLRGLRGAWQRNLHHARYGAEAILAAGGDPRVAELVARHHEPGADPDARLLHDVERLF